MTLALLTISALLFILAGHACRQANYLVDKIGIVTAERDAACDRVDDVEQMNRDWQALHGRDTYTVDRLSTALAHYRADRAEYAEAIITELVT